MWYISRPVTARFEVTDEEYVQRVRLTLAVYDRWGRLLLAFYTLLAVAFPALLVTAALLLPWLQGLAPGFVVGLVLGTMLGGIAIHIGHGLLTWLAPHRTEQLLLRYYDALSELVQGRCTGQSQQTCTACGAEPAAAPDCQMAANRAKPPAGS